MTKTISIKKFINYGSIILFFSFIAVYTFLKTKDINTGVELQISGIKNGQISETGILFLEGKAKNAKRLLINDKELLINEESDFKDNLVLSPGYNIITISAEDRFDKKEKIVYEVFFKEKNEVATLN